VIARSIGLALLPGLASVAWPSPAAAQPACLESPPSAVADVPVTIRLSHAGGARLPQGHTAFVQVTYRVSNGAAAKAVMEPAAVRQFDDTRQTRFAFGREGQYGLALLSRGSGGWPNPSETGQPIPGCVEQFVSVSSERKPEFAGVRGEAWAALRLPYHPEIGGAVYAGKMGLAASVSSMRSSTSDSRWMVRAAVHRRGARGYLGVGIAYEPQPADGRPHVKPMFGAGEELPPFKGHATWLILDLRLVDYHKNFVKDIRPSVALRVDFGRHDVSR
jgi:hypothetical protein